MNRFELLRLKNELRNKKDTVYTCLSAFDSVDRYNIPYELLTLESDLALVDDTGDIVRSLMDSLKKIMAMEYVSERNFEKLSIEIIPLLYYDVTTIDSNPDKAVAESKHLSCDGQTIFLIINIYSIEYDEKVQLLDETITGTVKYNNFYRVMTNLGFDLKYNSIPDLAKDIIAIAKEDELFPEFSIDVTGDIPKKYTI